jgi:DNA-binding MarR family transcriptional regulator
VEATRPDDLTLVTDGTGVNTAPIPGVLVRRAQQLATVIWQQETGLEVTVHQYAVLRVVRETPGLDQKMVCARAYFDRSTGADIIARLAKNGLLARVRDQADSRRNLLYLTGEGLRVYERLARAHSTVSERLLSGLASDERPQFMQLLEKLVDVGEATVGAGAKADAHR